MTKEEYEEQYKRWKDDRFNMYRQDLSIIMNNDSKNLDFFEEKITFLSAGAIGLSLYFISYEITDSLLYKIAIFTLLITLLTNLYSYLFAVRKNKEVIKNISDAINSDIVDIERDMVRIENQKSNNRFFSAYNEVCFWLFCIGVIMLLLSIFMLSKNTLNNNVELENKAITPPIATTTITQPPEPEKI